MEERLQGAHQGVVTEPAKPCTQSQKLQMLPQVRNCCLVMRGFHHLVVQDEEIDCWSNGCGLERSVTREGLCSDSCLGRPISMAVVYTVPVQRICRSASTSREKELDSRDELEHLK